MGPVTAIVPYCGSRPSEHRSGAHRGGVTSSTGRALVPVRQERRRAPRGVAGRRVSAAFLAQLIAADRKLPQARERRRAEPQDAITAYSAAARL